MIKDNKSQPEFPIIGIDYGTKNVGLAVSDFNGILSAPIKTLRYTRNWGDDEIIDGILETVAEYRAKSILIGLPQKFTDAQQKNIDRINSFVEKIKKKTDLKVYFQDESFSTKEAQNMLLSLGQNSKSSRGKIDKVSAALFLQNFLDSLKNEP